MLHSFLGMRRTLYRLKRRFATPIRLYKRENPTVDTKTGAKTCTLVSIAIKHAIVMQTRDYRMFVYDLAFISANKDFTTGGYFDPSERKIIIDKRDLPSNYIITNDQYISIGSKQYQIYEFSDNLAAYVLSVKTLRGEFDITINSTINVLVLEDSAQAYIDHFTYAVSDKLSLYESLESDEFSVLSRQIEEDVTLQDTVE